MSARNWEEKSRAIRRWLDDSRTLRVVAGAVALVALFPLVWLLIRSLSIGHERAANLLLRSGTLRVIGNSVALTVATTVLSISLGVPLAYLTERTDLPMPRLWSVVVSLPLVIPSYIGAFAYVYTFGPGGSFQSLLESFGVSSLPSIYGFPGTVFIITLYTYPYVYITARAALRSFDTTLVDAARSLRCSRLEAFKRVTVPQIKPAVAAGSLLVALYALSDFGTPMIMHFDAFTREIYVEFGAANRDSAALLSVVLVVLTVLILSVESWFRSDRTLYSQGRSRSKKLSLGRWRWVATLLPALVGLLALAVPLGVMVEWFLRDPPGYTSSLAFEWGYALNSVYVSVAAALVAGVAGVPVAYVSAKRDTRLSSLFERLSYVGYAVPGIVVGLSLVYFASSYAFAVYQTVPLLVLAYVVRFLPQSVGSTRSSFLQVDPHLPEAARTLGRSSVGAFRYVTLPLIAPGFLGGIALVFLTTMKELPATLMLNPPGFQTLVTHIWGVYRRGFLGYAAVPTALILLFSGVSLLVILSREGYGVR